MRKLFCWLILGILGFTLVTACNPQTSQNIFSSSKLSAAECRTIEHTMGETCVPVNPQRVVTLSVSTLGNALALGVKPIATSNEIYRKEDSLTPFQRKVEEIKLVGISQPNVEAILLLKPDLIVGPDWYKSIYPLLSQIAPTVLGESEFDAWRDHFSFVAEALGKQETEKALWERYNRRIEQLKLALENRYQNKKISFIYLGSYGISIDTKSSFVGSILNDALLQRPASQNIHSRYGSVDISLEELKKVDGDILFVTTYSNVGKKILTETQQDPLWKSLKAVRENHVYYVDYTSWAASNMLGTDLVIDDLFKYLVDTP